MVRNNTKIETGMIRLDGIEAPENCIMKLITHPQKPAKYGRFDGKIFHAME